MEPRSIAKSVGAGWLAALVALVAAGSAAAQDGQPQAGSSAAGRIEVEAEEIDLGSVSRGATVEARFRLRNAGAREVRILDVHPG